MIKKATLLALISLALFAVTSVQAASAAFSDGVRAYNGRQYSQALRYLSQAASEAPTDPMIHYYMGLSYQGMNQMTLAKQQFEWVASCRSNPVLAGQAQVAVQNLSRYKPTQSSGWAGTTASTASSGGGSPAASGQRASGKLKVIDFSTDWCHYCKAFEPVWEEVSSQMRGQVDFVKLDGDDEANNALKAKYNVTGYPRLIFTDKTGNALLNHRGAPKTAEDFKALINQYK